MENDVGGEWGIPEFQCIYAVFCEITHTTVLRAVFDQHEKTKKTSRHQVLAGEWSHVWGSIGFQLSTLNITLFVALTCVW